MPDTVLSTLHLYLPSQSSGQPEVEDIPIIPILQMKGKTEAQRSEVKKTQTHKAIKKQRWDSNSREYSLNHFAVSSLHSIVKI